MDLARIALDDPPHPKAVSWEGGRFQFHDGGQMPDVQVVTFAFDKLVMTLLLVRKKVAIHGVRFLRHGHWDPRAAARTNVSFVAGLGIVKRTPEAPRLLNSPVRWPKLLLTLGLLSRPGGLFSGAVPEEAFAAF